jgi:hypothetical protein
MRVTERILPNRWSNYGCAPRGKQQGIQYKQFTSASSDIYEGHRGAVDGGMPACISIVMLSRMVLI